MFFTIFCYVYLEKCSFASWVIGSEWYVEKYMLSLSIHFQCLAYTQSQPLPVVFRCHCFYLLFFCYLFILKSITADRQGSRLRYGEERLPLPLAVLAVSVSVWFAASTLSILRHTAAVLTLCTLSLVVSAEFLTAQLSDDLKVSHFLN